MIDTGSIWEKVEREVRAEVNARHRVVSLRRDMTARQRGDAAMRGLEHALSTLEMVGESIATRETDALLDDFDTRISLLRMRLKMKRTTAHL